MREEEEKRESGMREEKREKMRGKMSYGYQGT